MILWVSNEIGCVATFINYVEYIEHVVVEISLTKMIIQKHYMRQLLYDCFVKLDCDLYASQYIWVILFKNGTLAIIYSPHQILKPLQ